MQSLTLSPNESQVDYKNYIINTQIVGMRKGGRNNESTIYKYEDGTEWIYLKNKTKERFCGFLYLQNALKELHSHNVAPAENKMTIQDRKIIYLSRYCGENKPEFLKYRDELRSLKNDIGFTDITGQANLREEESKIYVFDTEKGSFDKRVHDKIDLFINFHDAIKASLEEKLKL